MNYHPIMGILTLIFCIILAYFIGKVITKKNILRWKSSDKDSNKPLDIGDANSPDAPWMKDKNR